MRTLTPAIFCSPASRSAPAPRPGSRRRSATTTRRAKRSCSPIRRSPCRSSRSPSCCPCPASSSRFPAPRPQPPEAADPQARVEQANGAARVQPTRAGYINAIQVYPFSDGALYQVYAAPGEITDIALEPGEQLVGSGPVAAGDTVRWIIGDTESGPAPTSASTSWSSRRGRTSSPISSSTPTGAPIISSCAPTRRPTWPRSPGPMRRTSSSRCAGRTRSPKRRRRSRPASISMRSTSVTAIEGDNPRLAAAARLRRRAPGVHRVPDAASAGRDAAALGDRRGGRRRARELSRPRQSHDRRSAVRRGRTPARRRAPEEGAHRAHRREAAVVTTTPRGGRRARRRRRAAAAGDAAAIPPSAVTRLSRKVLIGLGARRGRLASAARCSSRLQPQRQTTGSELYSTNNRNTPGRPRQSAAATTPGFHAAFRSSDRRCPAISAGRSSTPARRRRRCRPDPSPSSSASPRSRRRRSTSHLFATTNVGRITRRRLRRRRRPSRRHGGRGRARAISPRRITSSPS